MTSGMGPDGRGWGAKEVEYDLGFGGPRQKRGNQHHSLD